MTIGVSSLRGEEVAFPNTTDVDELVEWSRHLERVAVFATYASLGLGALERGPRGLGPDRRGRGAPYFRADREAVGGRARQPQDPGPAPAVLTATPRLWQLGDEDPEQGAPGELVASMDDDPDGPFDSRCYTLTLSAAIDPYTGPGSPPCRPPWSRRRPKRGSGARSCSTTW